MTVFFVWIILLLAIISLYGFFLWKRAAKQSRFQARLTILFTLFVLIPTISLTFLMSMLLSKSGQMQMQPGVEQALRFALDVFHTEMDNMAEELWQKYPHLEEMTEDELQLAGIRYVGRIGWTGNRCSLHFLRKTSASIPTNRISILDEETSQIRLHDRHGILLRSGGESYYEYYHLVSDTTIVFMSFAMPPALLQTKDELDRAVKNYTSFSLLRNTFFEHGFMWALSVLLIILLSLIAIWIAKWVSHDISKPIQVLTNAMKNIGSGDLSQRVDVKAKDELSFLIASFNRMVEDLQNSRESLQRAERAAAWRDAARQVSHEIKNSLTPIQLSLIRLRATLPQSVCDHSDFIEAFRIIEEELASMRRLADEFAEFARMPALTFKPESIQDHIRQSVRLAEAENPAIKINMDLVDSAFIPLDAGQFRSAIHNLLKNAAEASRPGDEVHVILRNGGGGKEARLQLIIRDQGYGMDHDILQKATQAYFTTKQHGTGLGLLIAQRIFIDHGAKMRLESERGKGTTVYIEF